MVNLGGHVGWECSKATLPCPKVKGCGNGMLGVDRGTGRWG